MIKIEVDPTELYQENNERDFGEETPIDVDGIKLESNLGDFYLFITFLSITTWHFITFFI